jgi:hypothetical protein
MAQSTANIIDRVLPRGVPLRQWVLTCPFELRARLGVDAPLLGELSAAVNDCLLGFYERALRARIAPLPTRDGQPERRRKLHSGTELSAVIKARCMRKTALATATDTYSVGQ